MAELIIQNDGIVGCCEIEDYPDMEYRGLIPEVATKRLVDTMARYKMNSLQLYIEHTYDFAEYEFSRKSLDI